MTDDPKPCLICGKIDNLEEHHIIPICYGGPKNGKTIFICSSCHFAVHKTAESVASKSGKGKNWFNDENLLKKAAIYVKAIIDAKRDYKEGKVSQDIRKRKLIVIELTDREWKRLHKVKKDKGFTNMTDFIQNLLINISKSI